MQAPSQPLPYLPTRHESADAYITSLLHFITTSTLHQTLCGGVHILDFLTREPDLYESVLPAEWRAYFGTLTLQELLDLVLRENMDSLLRTQNKGRGEGDDARETVDDDSESGDDSRGSAKAGGKTQWRGHPLPPCSFLEFISTVRSLLLDRSFPSVSQSTSSPATQSTELDRSLCVGMSAKKVHEVQHFSAFVNVLTTSLAAPSLSSSTSTANEEATPEQEPPSQASDTEPAMEQSHRITHLVDFGSGQNYLGRVLAGPAYEKSVIALESKPTNIEGARRMDVHAKLAKKKVVWRNKKMWRAEGRDDSAAVKARRRAALQQTVADEEARESTRVDSAMVQIGDGERPEFEEFGRLVSDEVDRRIHYVEHVIRDGDLSNVSEHVRELIQRAHCENKPELRNGDGDIAAEPQLMVISLHSCGNLLHHGLRSLVMNQSVKAVAMLGCCYNLCTERLGPPTYKIPSLRSANKRLERTSTARDPHGFPMSERFATYRHDGGEGIRVNITARMMAVQAPLNWTEEDCDSFFTRHFYRALLQRIFLDRGFVHAPTSADDVLGGTMRNSSNGDIAVTIGTLPKSAYKSFTAYVRGALVKLYQEPDRGEFLRKCMDGLTDEEIALYEERHKHKKFELCVVWTLMAFTAGLVECAMVADRWQYLQEQPVVKQAWVQTVFSYEHSPRNLAIIGIKW